MSCDWHDATLGALIDCFLSLYICVQRIVRLRVQTDLGIDSLTVLFAAWLSSGRVITTSSNAAAIVVLFPIARARKDKFDYDMWKRWLRLVRCG